MRTNISAPAENFSLNGCIFGKTLDIWLGIYYIIGRDGSARGVTGTFAWLVRLTIKPRDTRGGRKSVIPGYHPRRLPTKERPNIATD
jgi:hypothetical protein